MTDSNKAASPAADNARLAKELADTKKLVLEKKGENSLLHAQLKTRTAKHSAEVTRLLSLNAKTQEELQSEIDRQKRQAQQTQNQLELLRSELRMATMIPKRPSATVAERQHSDSSIGRPTNERRERSVPEKEFRPTAVGGDGFVLKRKKVASGLPTGPSFPSSVFSPSGSPQPLASGGYQNSQTPVPISQPSPVAVFNVQNLINSPAFAVVYDKLFEGARIGEILIKAASNGAEGMMDAIFTILNGGPPLATLSHLLKIVSDLAEFAAPPAPTLIRLVEQWIKNFRKFPSLQEAAKRSFILLERCDCYFLSACLCGLDILRVCRVSSDDLTDTWPRTILGCSIQTVRSRAIEVLASCNADEKRLTDIPDTQLFPPGPHYALEEMFEGLLDEKSRLNVAALEIYSDQYFRVEYRNLRALEPMLEVVYYELLEASTIMARLHNLRSQDAILEILTNEVDRAPPSMCQKRLILACVAYFWLFTNSGNHLENYGELVVCLGKITYGREYGVIVTAQARSILLHYITNPREMDELAESMGMTT